MHGAGVVMFLIAGPEPVDMMYWISNVTSLTADNGVEIHMIETPWVFDAFVKWINGTPLQDCWMYVDVSRRQFYNAARICGWNHLFSNLFKVVAHACPTWPVVLDQNAGPRHLFQKQDI